MRETILSNMRDKRLNYNCYQVWTKDTVWNNREAFLAYYEALKLEFNACSFLMLNTEEGYRKCLNIADECYNCISPDDIDSDHMKYIVYPWLYHYTRGMKIRTKIYFRLFLIKTINISLCFTL